MHPVIEALSTVSVLALDGRAVPVPELWRERTGVIIWLRHYG